MSTAQVIAMTNYDCWTQIAQQLSTLRNETITRVYNLDRQDPQKNETSPQERNFQHFPCSTYLYKNVQFGPTVNEKQGFCTDIQERVSTNPPDTLYFIGNFSFLSSLLPLVLPFSHVVVYLPHCSKDPHYQRNFLSSFFLFLRDHGNIIQALSQRRVIFVRTCTLKDPRSLIRRVWDCIFRNKPPLKRAVNLERETYQISMLFQQESQRLLTGDQMVIRTALQNAIVLPVSHPCSPPIFKDVGY